MPDMPVSAVPAALSEPDPADRERVVALLGAAGLPASDAEIDALARALPLQRSQIASLWAVAEARYAEPALFFSAEPPLTAW